MFTYNNSTVFYKFGNVERFANDIVNFNSAFYVFASNFETHANTEAQPIYDNPCNTYIYPYNSMVFGKIVNPNDIAYGIQYIPWTANTIYDMYDDQSVTLSTDQFFAITDEGSYFHIWKVLDNNNGAPSTVQPQFSFVSSSNTYNFQTADGYRWKYMTSINEATAEKYKVGSQLFPVTSNVETMAIAVPGSLDVIIVEDGGKHYNNYIDGVFRSADIFPTGSRVIFNISNTQVHTTNGYYTNCMIYVTSGVAKGEYRTISDFVSNTTGNYMTIDSQFLFTPQNGDTYSIYPKIKIDGDGQQTVNCAAFAYINALSSNAVSSIQVLEPGKNYRWANATVLANSVVGVTNTATLRVINTPVGGHGANVFTELYSHSLIICVKFDGTEGNTVPSTNKFQSFGLVKDPVWSNANFNFSAINGTFIKGETIYQIKPLKIDSNGTVELGSNVYSSNTGDFYMQLVPGEFIYYSTTDNLLAQLNMVLTVANSSTFSLVNASAFSCTSVNIYKAEPIQTAYCSDLTANAASIYVANSVTKTQQLSSFWIGASSGARAVLNNVGISGENKNYNTFVATYQYIATNTGSFIIGETLQSGNTVGLLHSTTGSGTIRMFASGSPFAVGDTVRGLTSNSTAVISTVYPPEILYESGEIQYIENLTSSITRQTNEIETIQLVLNF